MTGPLGGIRVLEVASIGPGPFCAMVLADLGAEVIRVERLSAAAPKSDPPPDPLQRGRTASIALNLKDSEALEPFLALVESVDVLIEGFRPGVMERLGVGPEACLRIVFGHGLGNNFRQIANRQIADEWLGLKLFYAFAFFAMTYGTRFFVNHFAL